MDDGIESLKKAVNISPENIPLRLHLASVMAGSGKIEEAQKEYAAVLALEKENMAAQVGMAEMHFRLGRFEEAAARLQEVLQREARNARARLLMARTLLVLGDREGAARQYREVIDLDPSLADRDLEKSISDEKQDRLRVPDGPDIPGEGEIDSTDITPDTVHRSLTFADVGGMEELKEQIRLNIIYPFLHPEIYLAYGKKIGGGILLYGPPGCGKTHIARATAGECKARFVSVGIEDVLDMWMGESERKLHALFEAARSYPAAVLFFDEIEAFAGNRTDMQHSPHYRVLVNQFLAEMDGAKGENRNILIIGATNTPWHVDAAFRRPGRFDKVIFVPPPDLKARVEILKIHCKNKPVEDLDYAKIAARMKKFSGADIEAVCDGAAEVGLKESMKTGKIRKLRTDDFLKVLSGIHPTTEEWLATAKNYATYSNQTGLYTPLAEYFQQSKE